MDSIDTQRLTSLPVSSFYFDGKDVWNKLHNGTWFVHEEDDPDVAKVMESLTCADELVYLSNGIFRWQTVSGLKVLAPVLEERGNSRLSTQAAYTSPLRDHNEGRTPLKRRNKKKKHRRRHRRSLSSASLDSVSSKDSDCRVLPPCLQDIALPSGLVKKLSAKRINDVLLEELLDMSELYAFGRRKPIITCSEKLLKSVTILVRYRVALFPVEANSVLKFLSQVQDLLSIYHYSFVQRLVTKHIRAVAANLPWDAPINVGHTDERDRIALCNTCNLFHASQMCGASVGAASVTNYSGPPAGFKGVVHRRYTPINSPCFNCNQFGHWAKRCPTLPQAHYPEGKQYQRINPRIPAPYKAGVQYP